MNRLSSALLIVTIAFVGWLISAAAPSNRLVATETTIRVVPKVAVDSQHLVVRHTCEADGNAKGSPQYIFCAAQDHVHRLRVLQAQFRALTKVMTWFYGVCIDRRNSKLVRCVEV